MSNLSIPKISPKNLPLYTQESWVYKGNFILSQDITKISPLGTSQRHSQYIPKISHWYPQDIPKIYPRYSPNIYKISPRCPQYILRIFPRYPKNIPKTSRWYPQRQDVPKISLRSPPCDPKKKMDQPAVNSQWAVKNSKSGCVGYTKANHHVKSSCWS